MRKKVIFFLVIDLIVALCFFLTYGPVNKFRDFLITTAMTTKSHKYLARTFYSEDMIKKVLSNNTISSFSSGTDISQIELNGKEETKYASNYEKEILEHKKNDVYKIIDFEYEGYDCYLTAIYDPSRVSLMESSSIGKSGETLTNMAKNHKALVSINAGGFKDPNGTGNGGIPMGSVIKNGKIAYTTGNVKSNFSGFTKDNILMLTYSTPEEAIKKGMYDAVEFGPFLIVNGVSATIKGNGGWGVNPRTAIAQRKDGIILFLIIDGNGTNKYNWSGRGGVTLSDLITILERYGAYNAANMDGGASTTMVVNNKLYNKPCAVSETGERRLPNGWMVK